MLESAAPDQSLDDLANTRDPDGPELEFKYDVNGYPAPEEYLPNGAVNPEYDQWMEEELERCSEDFLYWSEKYAYITHPKRGAIKFQLYGYQKRFIRAVEENRFVIVSKFRQGGLTTVTVVWMLWRCLFKYDQRIMIVSIGDKEAIAAGGTLKSCMDQLPEWMKPEMGKNNDHEKQFLDTNGFVWFRSPKGVRSMALTFLVLDEAAFIPKMDSLWAAMMPALATGGNCIAISTVNGMGNWYQETYYDAKAKKNYWHVVEMDYWENPDYKDPEWVKLLSTQLGPRRWQQEVLRSFLGSGATFIDSHIITRLDRQTRDDQPKRKMFEAWDAAQEIKNKNDPTVNDNCQLGAMWIWKEPMPGHEYIVGADAAAGIGTEGDYSAFSVIDAATCEQVADFYSNMITTHEFAQVLYEMGHYYNGAQVVCENLGPGMEVVNRLVHDLAYDNLYYEKDDRPGLKVQANRTVILEALQYGINASTFKIRSMRLVNELKYFIYSKQKKKPLAANDKHDDLIMATAFALFVRDEQGRRLPPTMVAKRSDGLGFENDYQRRLMDKIRKEIMKDSPDDWASVVVAAPRQDDPEDDPELKPRYMLGRLRPHNSLLREFGM